MCGAADTPPEEEAGSIIISSGDIFLAFSTANPGAAAPTGLSGVSMLPNERINPIFEAAVHAAETMTGANHLRVHALPHDRLPGILRRYNRLAESR